MEVNYLHIDELDYELMVRGLVTQANMDTKRSILRGYLNSEKADPNSSYPDVSLDFQLEVRTCQDKLDILDGMISKFNSDKKHPDYKRINTKLIHLKNRAMRLITQDQDQVNIKSEIIASIMLSFSNLERKFDKDSNPNEISLIDISPDELPAHLKELEHNSRININRRVSFHNNTSTSNILSADQPNLNLSSTNNQCENKSNKSIILHGLQTTPPVSHSHNIVSQHFNNNINSILPGLDRNTQINTNYQHISTPTSKQALYNPSLQDNLIPEFNFPLYNNNENNNKLVNSTLPLETNIGSKMTYIHKHNIKFSGKNQSLNNFLLKINEFCLAYNINKNQLINFAHEFFENEALHWFRANRNQINSWYELEQQLKSVFLPVDFELELWHEILNRTQGSNERSLIYIAIMENLFSRLISPLSDNQKLQIILRNLQPYIQNQLSLRQPVSLTELKSLCKLIEDSKDRIQNFKEPPVRNSNTLEPDLAYTKNINSLRNKCQINEIHEINKSQSNTVSPRCYNCGLNGHVFTNCRKPRNLFCFNCGHKNVTKRNCPKCSKNLSTTAPESGVTVQSQNLNPAENTNINSS